MGVFFSNDHVISEIKAEYQCVIMRPSAFLSIFAAHHEFHWPTFLAQSLGEFLPVFEDESPVFWQVFFIVCQCYEAVFLVHLRFMRAAHGPLPGLFKSASCAPSARDFDHLIDESPRRIELNRSAWGSVPGYRVIAAHPTTDVRPDSGAAPCSSGLSFDPSCMTWSRLCGSSCVVFASFRPPPGTIHHFSLGVNGISDSFP